MAKRKKVPKPRQRKTDKGGPRERRSPFDSSLDTWRCAECGGLKNEDDQCEECDA